MKNRNRRVNIALFVAVAILIAGIVLLVIGIIQKRALDVEYKDNYAAWHESWWHGSSSILDQPENPGRPAVLIVGIVLIPLGFISTVVSLVVKAAVNQDEKIKAESNGESSSNFLSKIIDSLTPEQSKFHKCEYCGTIIDAGKSKCENCGASVKNKK